ncbi:MAG: hypothetical protein ABTD50_16070 [Polyangiaceae bacterium]
MNSAGGGRDHGRRTPPPRDQGESAFAPILAAFVARVRGALAAVLVDAEGEAVDYAGVLDPFAARLAGAHWRIVLNDAMAEKSDGALWLAVGTDHRSYIARALPDGYALVVVLTRSAAFVRWDRAVQVCVAGLGAEAGWTGMRQPDWFAVRVTSHPDGRPLAVRLNDRLRAVEILGVVANGLGPKERGWRVRLTTGAETTLVREVWGTWYADEPLA